MPDAHLPVNEQGQPGVPVSSRPEQPDFIEIARDRDALPADGFGGSEQIGHHNRHDAGPMRRLDAVLRVFERDATRGRLRLLPQCTEQYSPSSDWEKVEEGADALAVRFLFHP